MQTKREGGIGLKKSEVMNKALLTKLCWRVVTRSEEVWCQVLQAKYDIEKEGAVTFKAKHRASSIWKDLLWSSNLLQIGLQ